MWKDSLIIDAVTHGYDFRPENRGPGVPPEAYDGLNRQFTHEGLHCALESRTPGYLLSFDEFSYGWTADTLARLSFEESDTDLIVYHEVGIWPIFRNGGSPWAHGAELKRAYPERVLLYSFVDPLAGPAELEKMHARAETGLVDGWKFYPADGTADPATGLPRVMTYDDPEIAFPFFAKAHELGMPHIAMHKAIPVGPGPLVKDRVEDVSTAALAFPDLTFEVVHDGWAFLEDACIQLSLHPNIYANLEAVTNLAVRRPRRFAEIIGQLLQAGGPDRILFATGTPVTHPQPVIEALRELEIPDDLTIGYDYPPLTPEIKQKIFGLNMARLHGIDVDAKLAAVCDDEWARRRAAARTAADVVPWGAHRERMAQEGATV